MITTMARTTLPAVTDFDMCDRCGARAYAVVSVNGATLYFCTHHLRQHFPAFLEKGYEIGTNLDIEKEVFFRKG